MGLHKFTKYTLIISAVAIVVGLILVGVSYKMLGGFYTAALTKDGWVTSQTLNLEQQVIELEDFSDIELNLAFFGRIKLIPDDRNYIEVISRKPLEIEQNGGKLTVTSQKPEDSNRQIMSVGVVGNSNYQELLLHFDSKKAWNKAEINISFSEFHGTGLDIDNLVFENEFGDMKIVESKINDATIHQANGSVSLNNLKTNDFYGESSFGDFKLTNCQINNAGKLSVFSGGLGINQLKGSNIVVKNQFGDTSISRSTINGLDITSESAEIDCQGKISGKIVTDSKFSDIDFEIDGDSDDYDVVISNKFGDSYIMNQNSNVLRNPNASNFVEINSESGDVSVSFKG